MRKRRMRIKRRAKFAVVIAAGIVVFGSGIAGIAALNGWFGGSESGDLTRGLVGHWTADDAGGALVRDQSGQGNDGMLNDGGSGNPVSYWDFDEGSGTTAIDRIGSNNGTLNGNPARVGGRIGGALEFDGDDDFVEMANPGLSTTTISGFAWVNTTESDTNTIFAQWDAVNNKRKFSVTLSETAFGGTGNRMEVVLDDTGAGATSRTEGTTDINDGKWHHIGFTYNSGTLKLYVDGAEETTTLLSGSVPASLFNSDASFRVASIESASTPFRINALIDDVRLYNYALAGDDVRKIYQETYKSKWVSGVAEVAGREVGSALQLDGIDDYVEVPGSAATLRPANAVTAAAWVKADELESASQQILRGIDENDGGNFGYTLTVNTSNEFVFFVRIGAANHSVSTPADTDWHHVVGTYDGTTQRVYVDGVEKNSKSTSGTISYSTGDLLVGISNTSNLANPFGGTLDDVRIYNRALSADEVRRLHNGRGPVAHWKLDEGSGRYAYDSARKSEDITSNLEGYWSLNETSGTRLDVSGRGNDLTDNNTVTSATGQSDNAGQFVRANSEYLSISDNASLSTGDIDFTIATWVYADSLTSGDHSIVAKWPTGDRDYLLQYRVSTSRFQFFVRNPADTADTVVNADSLGAASTATWYFIVAWHDAANDTLNIQVNNGTVDSVSYSDGVRNGTGTFSIGCRATPSDCWDGRIDEAYFFKRVLTADERTYLFNLGYNDGTLGNATCQAGSGTCPSWSTDSAPGSTGGSLDFDGADDRIAVDDQVSIQNVFDDGGTIEFWMAPRGVAGVGFSGLMDKDAPGSDGWFAILNGAGSLRFDQRFTTTSGRWDTSAPVTDFSGQSVHIAVVYDNGSVGNAPAIYVDGAAVQVTETTTPVGTRRSDVGNTLYIGNESALSRALDGWMDDVRIYNYARTEDQIRLDYNAGLAARFGGTPDLKSGLVGHWKFDEMAGTSAIDTSDNGNTGTLKNTPKWAQGVPNPGVSGGGGALEFDGVNEYVDVGNNSVLNLSSALSLSAWVKINNLGDSNEHYIVSNGTFGSNNGYGLEVLSGGSVRFTAWPGSASTAGGEISAGTWYHIAASYDGTNVTIYINGIAKVTEGETVTGTAANVTIGTPTDSEGNSTFSLSGSIDDVRIYNRALTAEEIRYLYNNNGPVGHWKLDEGSGTTAYDSSVNSNNGTITGATWTTGRFGSALDFDGTDDYVAQTLPAAVKTANITLSAWVQLDALGANQEVIGAMPRGADNDGRGARLAIGSTNKVSFSKGSGDGTYENTSGSTNLTTGRWYHVAATFDGSVMKVYLDGVEDGSLNNSQAIEWADKVSGNYPDPAQLYFGAHKSNVLGSGATIPSQDFLNGRIDDVRIHNYTRTTEQIRADYNAGLAAKFGGTPDLQRGLVGHWDFDESGGSLTEDRSGNGNDGLFNDGGSGNPVSYWDFDEGTGQTITDRIGSNNGTLGASSSSGTDDPARVGGKIGNALEFDGSNDYVNVPDSDTLSFGNGTSDTPMTISAWVKFTDATDNTIVAKKDDVTDKREWIFLTDTSDKLLLVLYDESAATASIRATSTPVVPENEWVFVTATYDATEAATGIALYINGAVVADSDTTSGTYTAMENHTSPVAIGANNVPSSPNSIAKGLIDDVAIHNYAMSAAQIRKLYSQSYKSKRAQGPNLSTSYHGLSGGGNAFEFDGVDDFIEFSGQVIPLGAKTVAFWVNRDAASAAIPQIFLDNSGGASANHGTQIDVDGNDDIRFSSFKGASGDPRFQLVYATTLATNQWVHIAMTWDGTTGTNGAKVYVDGVVRVEGTADSTESTNATKNLDFGHTPDGANYFDGRLDDVRIYNRALTAEEIRYLYNNNGPVLHLALDEGQGTTAFDRSGSNDATVTGATWIAGKNGNALNFAASGQFADVSDSSAVSPGSNDFSVSAWVRTLGDYSVTRGVILGTGQLSSASGGFNLYMSGTNTARFDYFDGTAPSPEMQGNKVINDGEWHHIVVVWDADTNNSRKLYVDGVIDKVSANQSNTGVDNALAMRIGNAAGGTGFPFTGDIDEIRIYHYLLSEEQILSDYNAGKSIYFK